MLKILIISDAHLFHKYAITPEEYNKVLIEQYDNYDIVVDCGDLTDKSMLSASQLNSFSHIYDNIDKPVYILSGNHDSLENETTASVFRLKQNIKVINNICVLDNMLFIPYINSINELYKELQDLNINERLHCGFSHLNITYNVYAMINLHNNTEQKLNLYCDNIFNGHIHSPEDKNTIAGNIYNIGSCSNISFGDSHIPNYSIFSTESNTLTRYNIKNSIVHRVFNNKIEEAYQEIYKLVKDYRLRCCFKLDNNEENLSIKQIIKDRLYNNTNNIVDICFSYLKNKDTEKCEQTAKQSELIDYKYLIKTLIDNFERDNEIKIIKDIKDELLCD